MTDDMPRYRLVARAMLGLVRHEAGTEITYLRWPTPWMQPINPAAERITAYLNLNAGNPRLPRSPWCDYSNRPDLPPLSAEQNRRIEQ